MRRAITPASTLRWTALAIVPMLVASGALGLTLDDVKRALDQRGAPSWTPRDSGVSESLGIDQRANPFGLDPAEVALEVVSPGPARRADVPARWDWRNVNGVNWVSPVKNQAKCGSCVAFATVGVAESVFNIAARNPNLNLDLSEEYLFGAIGYCDYGSQLSTGSRSINKYGTVDEACLPYMAGRLGVTPTQSKACSDNAARLYKTRAYTSLSGEEAVKAAVVRGPVMTSMVVYEDFMFYGSGVYQHVTGKSLGGHAIVIVGFNDDERYWIVKNSWADTWGEAGYFRIRYGDASGLGNSGYVMTADDPEVTYRVSTPAHLSAYAGEIPVSVINTKPATRVTALQYTLRPRAYGRGHRTELTGTIPADTLSTRIPVAQLEDGPYELQIKWPGSTRSDNVIVTVVNKAPTMTFELSPDFEQTPTIKDRVYFSIKTTSAVPLTSAVLRVRSADGAIDKSVTAMDPGPETKLGWRTTLVPNGLYEVWAVGKIGDLHEVKTLVRRYQVENPSTPSNSK